MVRDGSHSTRIDGGARLGTRVAVNVAVVYRLGCTATTVVNLVEFLLVGVRL